MADVAQDAPGPASPRPDAVALQQTSRADAPDKGKLRVFISYSRDEANFADQLEAALDTCGFETSIDRHGVSGGEEWQRRLGSLISEADTVVFVLTPTSARSPMCSWEAEEAERLRKRILPVICRPLEGASPPPQCKSATTPFSMIILKNRGRALAAASRSWSRRSTPTSIGCASTPATSSAPPSGTGVAGTQTDYCQATIFARQRNGRCTGLRMRRSQQHCTWSSSARAKRRRRRGRVPDASSSRRWLRPTPSAREPCIKPKRRSSNVRGLQESGILLWSR